MLVRLVPSLVNRKSVIEYRFSSRRGIVGSKHAYAWSIQRWCMTFSRGCNVVRQTETSVPKRDFRETHTFDLRIDAMARRIEEAGLPSQQFPFVAAWCMAYPNWNTLKENYNLYDAVCVLKGIRPVALLPVADLDRKDPFNDYILSSIENAGMVVKRGVQPSEYIVGAPERVAVVEEVFQRRFREGRITDAYHRELGAALGYPAGAVEHFLSAVARGQSPLEESVMAHAMPTEDNPYLRVRLPSGVFVAIC